jgi:hypothetical protein
VAGRSAPLSDVPDSDSRATKTSYTSNEDLSVKINCRSRKVFSSCRQAVCRVEIQTNLK